MLSCASNACFSFPFPSFTTIFFHDAIVQLRLRFLLFLTCVLVCKALWRLFPVEARSRVPLYLRDTIFILSLIRVLTRILYHYICISGCYVSLAGVWYSWCSTLTSARDLLSLRRLLIAYADFNRSADMLVVAFASLRIRSLGFYFLICCYLRIIIRSVLLLIPFYSFSVFYRLLRTGVPTVSFWRAFCWKSFLEGDVRVCLRFMLALI